MNKYMNRPINQQGTAATNGSEKDLKRHGMGEPDEFRSYLSCFAVLDIFCCSNQWDDINYWDDTTTILGITIINIIFG